MDKKKIPFDTYRTFIESECNAVKDLLIAKNREYGASVFRPLGVFSSMGPEQQIDVRIDDKLARIRAVREMAEVKVHEDTELDLIGYLILKRVARRLEIERNEGQV